MITVFWMHTWPSSEDKLIISLMDAPPPPMCHDISEGIIWLERKKIFRPKAGLKWGLQGHKSHIEDCFLHLWTPHFSHRLYMFFLAPTIHVLQLANKLVVQSDSKSFRVQSCGLFWTKGPIIVAVSLVLHSGKKVTKKYLLGLKLSVVLNNIHTN